VSDTGGLFGATGGFLLISVLLLVGDLMEEMLEIK